MSQEALAKTDGAEPVATPVATTPSEPIALPKVENRPLLLMYRDADGKQQVMIAGDGNGSWLLPKLHEIPRDNLDAHQHMVIPKANVQIIDFGTTKPTISLDHHAVCSWVPMDTAQKILGRQWQSLQTESTNPNEALQARINQLSEALDAAIATETKPHASSCGGCHSCNADTPSTTAMASSARHLGSKTPTQSMLAMLSDKTQTQIGAAY
ncbi:MAG: hypothetical protein J0M34_01075 [Alphaproteobacteria bacterium]|nr:hypothetical protein [Alphaproteobacteria bacterium]